MCDLNTVNSRGCNCCYLWCMKVVLIFIDQKWPHCLQLPSKLTIVKRCKKRFSGKMVDCLVSVLGPQPLTFVLEGRASQQL